ncbi:MAG: 2-amino-4-hydroxy-6-hydroxymethyldihydropteridine diphosphokinase [Pyrinomonadaceae bacterium]|jgi:2-amino-4-hydroxy-6-hydroxymethyldihydropteridine diphosphokinase|nr:2-amino-4-hydroxy-6-hydroxymethyldihydropteridine diphosphokinase [Pyrinomonadaceae bacterium]
MHTITHAYVGLGSNLGDRAGNLLLAVGGMLDAGLRVTRLSSVYETEPVGVPDAQPLFLNMVAELTLADATNNDADATTHADDADNDADAVSAITHAASPSPEQLLARLLRIEYRLGRRRAAPPLMSPAPRTIDLDLLVYGDARSATQYLTLPHPRLHLRRFVLAPLAELAPELTHPTLGRSFAALLSELSDASVVARWSPTCGRSDRPDGEIFN